MAKAKTQYVCQDCGHSSIRWAGQCGGCQAWNTLVEEAVPTAVKAPVMRSGRSVGGDGGSAGGSAPRMAGAYGSTRPQRLRDVTVSERHRLPTGLKEFDRVLGGGAMVGSLTLVAGDPGIGKSTLMTELGRGLDGHTLLYVTGEESAQQVKLRAQRMGIDPDGLFLFPETNVEAILAAAMDLQPDLMVVDSIQTVYRPDLTSAPGSVAQVRESTAALLDVTKTLPTTTFLIGHVTKQGSIAGPRVLEHMVDTVLHFEGDRHHAYRILRAVKNRFGAANELGVFEMREHGLKEIGNPSALFLSERQFGASGSAVVCALEGTRPLMVEVQALVANASYGTPQRTSTGFDTKRLQLLLAVLEKREGLRFSQNDVFLNVAGGVRLDEPAVDLAVALAVASSLKDVPLDSGTAVVGEVGLGGEIRAVSRIETRLTEIKQLGFERAMIPKANAKGLKVPAGLEILPVRRLSEALDLVC
ncbi:DNA repair protein RadA [Rubrivirga sp. SAORIC476]|uniref:DNA repair protein RadA n=1 Tax=Rubrivirga sp. SAORIC476 TaxID=1961794 RepID=UPI000BA91485|nr:DNA repair protein RadA [Rubrivirga sp. SAORIC476]MAQ92480.1 DNA repair protein RadA [Rhodothermaceae bacterium]MBC13849.1 DNA repair protein RadA [Rhodothermaceae bacterium]PAP79334.1 DNA repair protein RadA [Rubrivirga sp. SAORIC476]